jgi:hypothetical protein
MLKINLNEKNKNELERIFEGQTTQTIDFVAESVAQLAFDEWMGWLSSSERYSSLTDQSIERTIGLFIRLMPDKEPDINFLYNRLSIPYGRAKYIIQVISERQLRGWNQRALEQLKDALESNLAEVRAMSPQEKKTSYIKFQITKRSSNILINCIDQMPSNKKPIEAFKLVQSPLKETRIFELLAYYLEDVFEAIKNTKL